MQTCPQAQTLTGIARLAAESDCLSQKKQVTYFEIEAKSILNRCSNSQMPFFWTINPYRGCEFGCKYCYARYTHEYMGMDDGLDFERQIYSKRGAAQVLAEELSPSKLRGRPIALGTATDPYQPAERRFFTTRMILEVLAQRPGISLSITTKSDLVVRDIGLLRQIQKIGSVHVNISVTTMKPRLARLLEPRATTPRCRLQAVRKLAEQGIPVGVFIMPVIPFLTDDTPSLEAVARQAKEAGASYLGARPLFLMPSAQKVFLPFIEEKFPKLSGPYRRLYQHSAYVPEAYGQKIQKTIQVLRRKYHLNSHPPEEVICKPHAQPEQITFPFAARLSEQKAENVLE